ncbi:MAG: alanine racemase [Actinomycetota bacterium]|nr:alanine racemase [Actinomycetota bacterium]
MPEPARAAYVEIDLKAIAHNVRRLKATTAQGTLFMAVVKADGYGHGALNVARTALNHGADRLGVATLSEALELRQAGIRAPMHLLSEPPAAAIPDIIEHDLIPTVTTRDFTVELGRAAFSASKEARFHLKVDTGMNRIGIRAEEAAEFIAGLKGFPGLAHEGTMTHFATADSPGDWDFESQMKRFTAALVSLQDEGFSPGIVHASNSAGTILHPEAHFNMVRCGIALYGLHPDKSTYGRVDLRPAMSVKATLSLVKRIGMGEGVSYGLVWRAAAPTIIGTLPLGYADGVHRVLSDRFSVLVGGARCAQVGRVCMDQFMIELPRGSAFREGEPVVLVGSQGQDSILMDELAELAGTINYELACSFGMRLPKRYV